MRKHNLIPNNGLSITQAQSISNLCNQRAKDIDALLSNINNFSKTIDVGGKNKILVQGKSIPENVVELLKEKSKLHACQAFLMENIKMKETLFNITRTKRADVSSVVIPEEPEEPEMVRINLIPNVTEEWGWEQLTADELNKYSEAEAYASHIGQFIHKGQPLDRLRTELPTISSIDWMELKTGEKTPVDITVHHTPAQLLTIHESLSNIHREFEQKVNYFKAKVKNLVTTENTRIANLNSIAQNDASTKNRILMNEYESLYKKAQEDISVITSAFEIQRQVELKEIATMRINVDVRYQETIDLFLDKTKEVEGDGGAK